LRRAESDNHVNFDFHSRANFCASAICAGVICGPRERLDRQRLTARFMRGDFFFSARDTLSACGLLLDSHRAQTELAASRPKAQAKYRKQGLIIIVVGDESVGS
jgi:hypothetical protein